MSFPFLHLPRELRDLVYEHYTTEQGGYIYDYATRKLTTADKRSIDLSLSRTCTQIAAEMRGIALRTNTFTFKTSYIADSRLRAGRYGLLLEKIHDMKCGILTFAQGCITATDAIRLASVYPQLVPVISELQRHHGYDCSAFRSKNSWGEAPSLLRELVQDTLAAISAHPNFLTALSGAPIWNRHSGPGVNAHEILSLPYKPWSIPSDSELTHLERTVPNASVPWRREKYRFSAAAVATQYLASLPLSTRMQLRHVVLEEDHVSVADSECHAQGLIRFCQENIQLRIERRLSLWRNVFRSASASLTEITSEDSPGIINRDQLFASCATSKLGCWIAEAQALPTFGMPHESFRLIFDSDGIPQKTSQIFDLLIQRDIAWQLALDECYSRSILPTPSWFDRRSHDCYKYEGLPSGMRDIVNHTSNIRCDFDPGDLWNVEDLITKYRSFTSREWSLIYCKDSFGRIIEPAPPLPTMTEICLEDVLLDEPEW